MSEPMVAGAQIKQTEKNTGSLRLAVGILAGAAAILILAELGVSLGLSRASVMEREMSQEIAAAARIRTSTNGPRQVLVLGNSLLAEGVDFRLLENSLGSEIQAHRLVVRQTYYFDWYYGIRKLLADGARPDTIAVALDATQVISNLIRGDYSANRLFRAADLLPVARDVGLQPTQAASLWFAHYSTFYGRRVEIRKWLLSKVMPSFDRLLPYLPHSRAPLYTRDFIIQQATPRLKSLRELTDEYGVRLLVVVPATPDLTEDTSALLESGRGAAVNVVAPLAPGEAPLAEFTSDRYHMNGTGARRYTAALAQVLKGAVLNGGHPARNAN